MPMKALSKFMVVGLALAQLALSACTEGRLSRKYAKDDLNIERALTPGRTIAAGGGISTAAGIQTRATLGETAGAPHVSTAPGIQLRSGVQAVVGP